MEPAAISARPAVTTMAVESMTPETPAARANGTVRPSAMPITMSRTIALAVKWCSTCGVSGMAPHILTISTAASRYPLAMPPEATILLGAALVFLGFLVGTFGTLIGARGGAEVRGRGRRGARLPRGRLEGGGRELRRGRPLERLRHRRRHRPRAVPHRRAGPAGARRDGDLPLRPLHFHARRSRHVLRPRSRGADDDRPHGRRDPRRRPARRSPVDPDEPRHDPPGPRARPCAGRDPHGPARARDRSLVTRHPSSWRVMLLIAVGVGATAVVFSLPPIPQDAAYHQFADRRPMLGLPNALNVLSNFPFVVVGIIGLARVARAGDGYERLALLVIIASLALTGVGSAYYHLAPSTATLFWDRLPMTVAFASLTALTLGERVSPRAGPWLLTVLVVIGVTSVVSWQRGELAEAGDLRL